MAWMGWRRRLGLACAGLALFGLGAEPSPTVAPLPERLSQTGLYADIAGDRISAELLAFNPQYPLWSDGSLKRRWIRLPAGTRIDASDADAWRFPRGTVLWKEFSMGRRVETRMVEHLADGRWRFSTYVWLPDGSDAELAPADGIAALPVADAPDGKYRILAQADCRACHGSAPVPVLGFSALQLSPDRDPLAANAQRPAPGEVDLLHLAEGRLVEGLDASLLRRSPRIAARTPIERAALGYLHGNCGHCHNANCAEPRLPLDLVLAQPAHAPVDADAAVATLLRTPLRYRRPGAEALVVPGDPTHSVLALRLASTDPLSRMPPLGTTLADPAGVMLVEQWLRELPPLADASAATPSSSRPSSRTVTIQGARP